MRVRQGGKLVTRVERCCAQVAEGGGRKHCCEWIGSFSQFHNEGWDWARLVACAHLVG